jgi:hypothetical protein
MQPFGRFASVLGKRHQDQHVDLERLGPEVPLMSFPKVCSISTQLRSTNVLQVSTDHRTPEVHVGPPEEDQEAPAGAGLIPGPRETVHASPSHLIEVLGEADSVRRMHRSGRHDVDIHSRFGCNECISLAAFRRSSTA